MAKSTRGYNLSVTNRSWLELMASIRSIREGKSVSASAVLDEIVEDARTKQMNAVGIEKIVRTVKEVNL